jgi:DNA-binding transcriptional LysR family regulator
MQLVIEGELDVAVAEISTAMNDVRLETEPLPRHHGAFICRPNHPLTREPALTLEQIQEYPLVASSLPDRFRPMRGVHRVDTFDLIRDIVFASDTIGMATASQVAEDERAGRLVRLPPSPPWLHTDYGFLRLKGRSPSPPTLAFMAKVRELEKAMAEDLPETLQQPR